MNSTNSEFKGLVVVRNSQGLVRANNYEHLEPCFQKELQQLIARDNYVTAESYPDKDPRFFKEA